MYLNGEGSPGSDKGNIFNLVLLCLIGKASSSNFRKSFRPEVTVEVVGDDKSKAQQIQAIRKPSIKSVGKGKEEDSFIKLRKI